VILNGIGMYLRIDSILHFSQSPKFLICLKSFLSFLNKSRCDPLYSFSPLRLPLTRLCSQDGTPFRGPYIHGQQRPIPQAALLGPQALCIPLLPHHQLLRAIRQAPHQQAAPHPRQSLLLHQYQRPGLLLPILLPLHHLLLPLQSQQFAPL
jgi:hypothetical protein